MKRRKFLKGLFALPVVGLFAKLLPEKKPEEIDFDISMYDTHISYPKIRLYGSNSDPYYIEIDRLVSERIKETEDSILMSYTGYYSDIKKV